MAASSSTSSSEHPPRACGTPWALIFAVAIVVIVDLLLRTRDPHELIAYPELAASDDQTVTYTAVRQYVELDGPADIVFIGSSQMREGVSMPTITAELQPQLPDERIANYALRGSKVDSMESVSRFLSRQPKPPKLAVIGISVRDFRGDEADWPRMAVFWNFDQWKSEARHHFADAASVFPIVLRSGASEVLHTLRYREQIAMNLANIMLPKDAHYRRDGNPILGELTWQAMGSRGSRRVDQAAVAPRRMLTIALRNYRTDEPAAPAKPMMLRLKQTISDLQASGTKVLLVEMPVAKLLQTELSRLGMARKFDEAVTRLADEQGVRFIRVENQPIEMTDEFFIDMQHHNRVGSEKFAKWLAGEIVGIIQNTPTTGPTIAMSTQYAHTSQWTFKQKIARALWMIVQASLFRWSWHNMYGWRRFLLKLFGAKIGKAVRIRPTARIEIPWNIDLADGVVVGDFVTLYSLGTITIGEASCISQHSYLCAGSHDFNKRSFDLLKPPIVIGRDCWVAADAFVGPGVSIGDRSVIGARSTVLKNIGPDAVAGGYPAREFARRELKD